jgi:hypothetical protein
MYKLHEIFTTGLKDEACPSFLGKPHVSIATDYTSKILIVLDT